MSQHLNPLNNRQKNICEYGGIFAVCAYLPDTAYRCGYTRQGHQPDDSRLFVCHCSFYFIRAAMELVIDINNYQCCQCRLYRIPVGHALFFSPGGAYTLYLSCYDDHGCLYRTDTTSFETKAADEKRRRV